MNSSVKFYITGCCITIVMIIFLVYGYTIKMDYDKWFFDFKSTIAIGISLSFLILIIFLIPTLTNIDSLSVPKVLKSIDFSVQSRNFDTNEYTPQDLTIDLVRDDNIVSCNIHWTKKQGLLGGEIAKAEGVLPYSFRPRNDTTFVFQYGTKNMLANSFGVCSIGKNGDISFYAGPSANNSRTFNGVDYNYTFTEINGTWAVTV